VLLLLGFFSGAGPRQATLLVAGFAIASLGALEVTVREHFAGYRSHTLLLASVPAVVTLGLLFYLAPPSLPPPARLAIAASVFGLAAWGLTAAFRARSGGRAFRVKAPRR
jgi:RsiW-degrading membrane proteinase PrsW (M82 family)